jgi:hypothetical protein
LLRQLFVQLFRSDARSASLASSATTRRARHPVRAGALYFGLCCLLGMVGQVQFGQLAL